MGKATLGYYADRGSPSRSAWNSTEASGLQRTPSQFARAAARRAAVLSILSPALGPTGRIQPALTNPPQIVIRAACHRIIEFHGVTSFGNLAIPCSAQGWGWRVRA